MRRPNIRTKTHCSRPLLPIPGFGSLHMASVLKVFHHILCKLRSSRVFFHHFFRRWALFLAFLGRRLCVWRLWDQVWDDRKRGTFPRVEQAKLSSPCTRNGLELREYVVAASYIPASVTRSASHPASLHHALQQPQPATSLGIPLAPADFSVGPPSHPDHVNPSSVSGARIEPNRRSSDSRVRRRSSDRRSTTQTHSRESSLTPVSPPTPSPRAPHRQFGPGPSLPPSRESSRSPSPTPQLPLEIDVFPYPRTQVDRRNSPITPPSVTSYGHVQPSPSSIHGHRRRQSSTSVVVGIVNPSTDSLPHRFFTDGPPLTEEPYTMDSPISYLSIPDIDLHEGLPQHRPTTPSPSDLPAGRFLQLVNSEQVPRYTKEVTVQVDYIVATIKPLSLLAGPAKEHTMSFHL